MTRDGANNILSEKTAQTSREILLRAKLTISAVRHRGVTLVLIKLGIRYCLSAVVAPRARRRSRIQKRRVLRPRTVRQYRVLHYVRGVLTRTLRRYIYYCRVRARRRQ